MKTSECVSAVCAAAFLALAQPNFAAVPACGGHGDRASLVVSTAWLGGSREGKVPLSSSEPHGSAQWGVCPASLWLGPHQRVGRGDEVPRFPSAPHGAAQRRLRFETRRLEASIFRMT